KGYIDQPENTAEGLESGVILKDRLMYGTDWMMLSLAANSDGYLADFIDFYGQVVDGCKEDMDKFFYQNAVKFLGLNLTSTQNRLKDFYSEYGLENPLIQDGLIDEG
ncbi:amidohydrolase, partial [bacterium]|nr:amidohydrolase [bacterium]